MMIEFSPFAILVLEDFRKIADHNLFEGNYSFDLVHIISVGDGGNGHEYSFSIHLSTNNQLKHVNTLNNDRYRKG